MYCFKYNTKMSTMNEVIQKRLSNACPEDKYFMHVCAIIPYTTSHDIKNSRWEKCGYWDELIT